MSQAFLLEAIARDALGDQVTAGQALERALDLAEPDGAVFAFLLHPAPELLSRHAGHGTAHAALIAEILDLMAGNKPVSPRGELDRPREPLSAKRGQDPAFPADQPVRAGDRRPVVGVGEHRSGRICGTCTKSSACTAVPRPSSRPGPSASSRSQRAGRDRSPLVHGGGLSSSLQLAALGPATARRAQLGVVGRRSGLSVADALLDPVAEVLVYVLPVLEGPLEHWLGHEWSFWGAWRPFEPVIYRRG